MNPLQTSSGRRLVALLPEVYRTRDAEVGGHMAAYLDACGALLDGIHDLLTQRLADSFPDNPASGRACQDWLLPYFARLFDVDLVSPHMEGRREEVANAVRWRQRKGTAIAIEAIAEAVGRHSDRPAEVELHEGFRRVATTARIGWPVFPAWAWGESRETEKSVPQDMATHPGLPAVTVDLRRFSRAIETDAVNPAAKTSSFDGERVTWRQLNRHGAPCFPGSFDDPSRRTVDLRTPDVAHGRYHPRRVLVFYPPPSGFFPRDTVRLAWTDRATRPDLLLETLTETIHRIAPPAASGASTTQSVTVEGEPVEHSSDDVLEINRINFSETVTLDHGRLVLRNAAFKKIVVTTAGETEPVVDAQDCLFDAIEAPDGLVRLVGCTIMTALTCARIQASDCILPDSVTLKATTVGPGCIRYSRIPGALLTSALNVPLKYEHTLTAVPPVFADFNTCVGDTPKSSLDFGSPGYGVLDPATSESITAGAENGGEMGAYGHRRYCLQRTAMEEKLRGFLPLGMEAVLIADARLLQPPPGLTVGT